MQTHPFQDLIDRLDGDAREMFEERAAIREFDALLPREHAEALALLDLLRMHPSALAGVTALRVELGGAVHFVLTTDADGLRPFLISEDGTIETVDLARLVRERFGGAARLTAIA